MLCYYPLSWLQLGQGPRNHLHSVSIGNVQLDISRITANIVYFSRSDGFPYPLDDVDKLEEASLAKYEAYLANKTNKNGCTLEKATKRQEWYEFFI